MPVATHYPSGKFTDTSGGNGGQPRHQCGGCGDPIMSSYDKWLSVFSGQRACRGYWRDGAETAASPEAATPAPVYREGDRVNHLGCPATVAHGNVPDEWGAPVTVNIRYDRAPRGHSPQKDVLASEVTPLGSPGGKEA